MWSVTPVSALRDNYIWLLSLRGARQVAIIDPGDATPVLAAIERDMLEPVAILATHHHGDHTGGIPELLRRFDVPVFGPALESIPGRTHAVSDANTITIPELRLELHSLHVPGHTLGAIAYFGAGAQCLFSGDTLFTAGCGRLFEGTAVQMHDSLQRLAALPTDTLVYCGHEYTESNLRFAAEVEPENADVAQRQAEARALRAGNAPTVPASLAIEKRTNPFLRVATPAVRAAAERHTGRTLPTAPDVFSALRTWKDGFRAPP